ncbi:hypothetical protein [Micromonospora sp. NPDC049900]|uniref:hypothetical protein n=1 Tax=unclassified Micromonospora TaxID=2617518 RepID=UPI0037B4DAD5
MRDVHRRDRRLVADRTWLREQAEPLRAWCKPSCGNRARVSRHHRRQTANPTVP